MIDQDIGGRIRCAREHRGLSLSDAVTSTKLPIRVVRAIERNDFASLPAGMYRKAYLRTLAAAVGLDPNAVAAEFDASYQPCEIPPSESSVATRTQDQMDRAAHTVAARNDCGNRVLRNIDGGLVQAPTRCCCDASAGRQSPERTARRPSVVEQPNPLH